MMNTAPQPKGPPLRSLPGVPAEIRAAVTDLILDSVSYIDQDHIDEWIGCFDQISRYLVIPRENRIRGYAAAVIRCETLDVIKDRMMVLEKSSKYNPHWDRHYLNGTQIVAVDGDVVTAHTNFMIVQTTLEGFSKLFVAGCYEDRILLRPEGAKIRERVVVLDTFSVPNLIATPL